MNIREQFERVCHTQGLYVPPQTRDAIGAALEVVAMFISERLQELVKPQATVAAPSAPAPAPAPAPPTEPEPVRPEPPQNPNRDRQRRQ